MDSERPHRTTTSTSNELFICFTSRLSSSSMKNILSPAHAARDPPPTTSLSRRLRTNGSLKGGQASPMFPSVPKKRGGGGGAFENPEPTSPKVTCIGQVRVKSKKKTKQTRSLSKRSNGEASFRKIERTKSQNNDGILHQSHQVFNHEMNNQNSDDSLHNRNNQRWVHFPVTICEALRTFGAEFNCLFPCRSPCFLNNNQRDNNEEKSMELSEESSSRTCGDVFSRWLVALHDGGKGREIELVVGGGDEVEEVEERAIRRSSRRHVLEDFEIKNEIKIEDKYQDLVEEEPRFSISIPPKNALLLMRCRSDPARVTALANKFWESPLCEDDEEDDEENKYEGKEQAHVVESKVKLEEKESVYEIEEQEEETETELGKKTNTFSVEVEEKVDKEAKLEEETERELGVELVQDILEEKFSEEKVKFSEEKVDQAVEEIEVNQKVVMEEENKLACFLSEAIVDLEIAENEVEDSMALVEHEDAEAEEKGEESAAAETLAKDYSEVEEREKAVTTTEESTMENVTEESSLENEETHDQEGTTKSEERERKPHEQLVERESDEEAKMQEREDQSPALPDCLLLMMSEPKLSMEVSKESWVCRTDFIKRSSTEKAQVHPTDGPDESIPVHPVQCNKPVLQQLERSSCSFPAAAAVSIATMREQKLVNAVAYEPFVLTRCKSEPMRTAAKVEPEACFWKSRTIERHRFGVGAAGVGF